MFILKLIEDDSVGLITPDTSCVEGGVDTAQIFAFRHLMPLGFCDYMWREALFELAYAHDWTIQVNKKEESKCVS